MTALLLYAYVQGIFSSRKIAQACEERVDFMAVTGIQRPDHRTICKFRKRHLDALSRFFVQVLQVCQRLGLVEAQGDELLAAEVAQWMSQAEQQDVSEDRTHDAERRDDELPEHIVRKRPQRPHRSRTPSLSLGDLFSVVVS